jgi:hypothetical protein
MILPILTYGSEVWGFHNSPDIAKVHLKLLKQVSGVRPQTSTSAVLGEFGRFPLTVYRKIRIVKFWYRIMKALDAVHFKIMFIKDSNGNVTYSWTKKRYENVV